MPEVHLTAVTDRSHIARKEQARARRNSRPQLLNISRFRRALTEARVFLRRIAGGTAAAARRAYKEFVSQCARYVVRVKPGRNFPRNKQEYRAKARGHQYKSPGRPGKRVEPYAFENSVPETLTDSKGEAYALG